MAMLPSAGLPSNPVFKLLAGAAAARHGRPNAHDLDFAGDPAAAAQMWLHRHPAAQAAGNIPEFVLHDLASAVQHAQHGAVSPAPQMPLAPPAPTPAPPIPVDVSNGFRAPVPVPIDVSNGFRAPGPPVPIDVSNGFRAPFPQPQPEPQGQRIGYFGPHGGGIATLPPGQAGGGLMIPNPNLTNGVKPLGRQSLLARAAAGRY